MSGGVVVPPSDAAADSTGQDVEVRKMLRSIHLTAFTSVDALRLKPASC
jgi:hypothetical protein